MSGEHLFDHHIIGVVSTNCFVVGDPKNAILFDPGGEEAVEIVHDLSKNGVEVGHVIATHGHFDHLGWATEVQNAVEGAKVYLHEDEKPIYEEFIDWMGRYNLPPVELREPDVWVSDNEVLDLGGYQFQVKHTPGHSPGSAVFSLQDVPSSVDDDLPLTPGLSAFVGDTLFAGSIGRVDLPHSDKNAMKKSLRRLIDEIDPNTRVLPGHGALTSMKKELNHNPYLKALQNGIEIF